MMTVIFKLIMV